MQKFAILDQNLGSSAICYDTGPVRSCSEGKRFDIKLIIAININQLLVALCHA